MRREKPHGPLLLPPDVDRHASILATLLILFILWVLVGGTHFQPAEELREVIFHARQIHFIQQHQQHLIPQGLVNQTGGPERVHVHQGARQIGGSIALLHVIIEAKQILGAVPSRLDRDLQEAQAHHLGVAPWQQALAGPRHPGEHRHLRDVVDLERRMEGPDRPFVVLQVEPLQMQGNIIQGFRFALSRPHAARHWRQTKRKPLQILQLALVRLAAFSCAAGTRDLHFQRRLPRLQFLYLPRCPLGRHDPLLKPKQFPFTLHALRLVLRKLGAIPAAGELLLQRFKFVMQRRFPSRHPRGFLSGRQ